MKNKRATPIDGFEEVDLSESEDPVQCCWNKEFLNSIHLSKAYEKGKQSG